MPIAAGSPAWNRKPMIIDASTSSTAWTPRRELSLTVRPTRKAERAIGSERKRSIIPVCMSVAMPTPLPIAANTMVCTRTAGTTKSL